MQPSSSSPAPGAPGPSHTEALAEAVWRAGDAALPEEVRERLVWTLIDNVGVMLHGARLPEGVRFAALMRERTGDPVASIPGGGGQAPVERAAAAQAFLIHAAEIDDSDLRAQLRASAGALPALLTLAEAYDVTGSAFLKAAAAAYTAQGRLSAPSGPIQRFGWMSSGVWGPISACAAGAWMIGLKREQAVSAMGLAGSAAGGAFQYFYDQTEEKRIVLARAARTAVESLLWAERGEIGPGRILEGAAGLFRLFGQIEAPAADELFGDFAELEGVLHVLPKYFAASHSIIPTLEGIVQDVPADLDPGAIERFVVRGDAGWGEVLADKVERFKPPETTIGAMINYTFVIALFLHRRSVMPVDYSPATLADPAILALAAKGRYEVEPTPSDLSIELHMRDGRTWRVRARTPGRLDRAPLEADRRLAKFEALTAPHIDASARAAVIDLCRALPEAGSMRDWVRALSERLS